MFAWFRREPPAPPQPVAHRLKADGVRELEAENKRVRQECVRLGRELDATRRRAEIAVREARDEAYAGCEDLARRHGSPEAAAAIAERRRVLA